jgi:hypothetical protein
MLVVRTACIALTARITCTLDHLFLLLAACLFSIARGRDRFLSILEQIPPT